MSFNSNTPADKQQNTEQVSAAIRYLKQGFNAQAFLMLSEQGSEKVPAARFALGLCYLRAGDASSAIQCFEQSLQLLKSAPLSSPGPSGVTENNETYIKLAAEQIEKEAFLNPMDIDLCTRFPKTAEQTVILALIYAYKQKGMTEQAQRLSSGLTGPIFEAYKKKLL